MELVMSLAIGVLTGSGACGCCCAHRTFQVAVGLALLGYAVNLFIFSTGGLRTGAAAIVARDAPGTLAHFTDPLPQAARADRHRDRLRDDGAAARRAARGTRPLRHRPCRWAGARVMSADGRLVRSSGDPAGCCCRCWRAR